MVVCEFLCLYDFVLAWVTLFDVDLLLMVNHCELVGGVLGWFLFERLGLGNLFGLEGLVLWV